MSVTFDLPADAEQELRDEFGDLGRAAKEAFVAEGYRARRFGIGMVRRLMGFDSRREAEAWLAGRGVEHHYSAEDLEADRATLDRVLGKAKP